MVVHKEKIVPVISLDFPNLPKVFPSDLLEKAKVVTAPGRCLFHIQQRTDAVWADVASLIFGGLTANGKSQRFCD
jgi:hypothetical protein